MLLLQVHGHRVLQTCPDEHSHTWKEASSPTWTNPVICHSHSIWGKKEERNPVNKVTRSHDWETVVQQDDLNQAPDQQHLAGLVLWWHPSGVTPG